MLRPARRLLLIGSTVEALGLAEAIAGADDLRRRFEVIAARARDRDLPTEIRRPPPAEAHRGAFDGAEGMAEAMRWDRIDLVVDASHPTETEASEMARIACERVRAPLLRLLRPPWAEPADAAWTRVADLAEAAHRLPFFARAFLAAGRAELPAFRERRDLWFLGRVHAPPAARFPLPRGDYAVGRPPFSVAHERTLLEDYRINWVVLRNDGGPIARPLLEAASERGATVMMIDRQSPPSMASDLRAVETVTEAVAWLRSARLA